MKTWQIEYYNGFPNIRVRFTVTAETSEEAERKAATAIKDLRRTAFYTIGPLETERRRRGDGEPL